MIIQKYKFFVNSTVVILCDNPEIMEEFFPSHMNFEIIEYENIRQLKGIVNVLNEQKEENQIVIFNKNIDKLRSEFLSLFNCINAAGGVVQNIHQEVLLIFRRGSWDLPKGKVDKGETLDQTAIREVQEETGLIELELGELITVVPFDNHATYHTYKYKNEEAMKISYWYSMNYLGTSDPIPQTEEDIEKVKWVKVEDLPNYYSNMYGSIIDVLEAVFGN